MEELQYADIVRVISGFYIGLEGVVTLITDNKYYVEMTYGTRNPEALISRESLELIGREQRGIKNKRVDIK